MLNHQPRSGWTRGETMPNLSDDDYMLPYGKRYRTMPDTLPERHISARDILSGVLPTKPRQETISGETRRIASSILYQTLCMGAATNFKPSRLLNIGHPEYTPKPNISSRATAFAKANDVLSPNQDDRGSMRGAFRHGLWQAEITSQYGKDLAERVGNCHELGQKMDTVRTAYRTIDEADRAADLRNNVIGRQLGDKYKDKSMKSKTYALLVQALVDGLFVSKQNTDGTYDVKKEKISSETFNRYLDVLNSLDENGNTK